MPSVTHYVSPLTARLIEHHASMAPEGHEHYVEPSLGSMGGSLEAGYRKSGDKAADGRRVFFDSSRTPSAKWSHTVPVHMHIAKEGGKYQVGGDNPFPRAKTPSIEAQKETARRGWLGRLDGNVQPGQKPGKLLWSGLKGTEGHVEAATEMATTESGPKNVYMHPDAHAILERFRSTDSEPDPDGYKGALVSHGPGVLRYTAFHEKTGEEHPAFKSHRFIFHGSEQPKQSDYVKYSPHPKTGRYEVGAAGAEMATATDGPQFVFRPPSAAVRPGAAEAAGDELAELAGAKKKGRRMNRRSFLGFLGLAAVPVAAPVTVAVALAHEAPADDSLKGVGVLRVPMCQEGARAIARQMCENIKAGTIIALPNRRDDHGDYLWDFRIECGDPKQVRVERKA